MRVLLLSTILFLKVAFGEVKIESIKPCDYIAIHSSVNYPHGRTIARELRRLLNSVQKDYQIHDTVYWDWNNRPSKLSPDYCQVYLMLENDKEYEDGNIKLPNSDFIPIADVGYHGSYLVTRSDFEVIKKASDKKRYRGITGKEIKIGFDKPKMDIAPYLRAIGESTDYRIVQVQYGYRDKASNDTGKLLEKLINKEIDIAVLYSLAEIKLSPDIMKIGFLADNSQVNIYSSTTKGAPKTYTSLNIKFFADIGLNLSKEYRWKLATPKSTPMQIKGSLKDFFTKNLPKIEDKVSHYFTE